MKNKFTTAAIILFLFSTLIFAQSPTSSGTSVTTNFAFTAVAVPPTTHLQVSTATDFSALVLDKNLANTDASYTFNAADLIGSLAGATNFNYNTSYYWRIYNTGGSSVVEPVGPPAYYTFTTEIAIPVLTAPANAAIDQSITPTFSWTLAGGSGGVTYDLQYYTGAGAFPGTTVAGVTSPYSSTTFSYVTTVTWRIVAHKAGEADKTSGSRTFTTVSVPDPALTSPANYAVGVSILPSFSWGSVSGATSYRLQISTSNTFGSLKVDSTGLAGTAATLNYGQRLDNGTRYYWRVKAVQGANSSAGASYREFTTVTSVVPIVSAITVLGNSVMLTWYPSPYTSGIKYDLMYSLNADMSASTSINNLTNTYYTLTGLNAGATYYLLIRTKNSAGTVIISYSSISSFATASLPTPYLSYPTGGATVYSTTPTSYWYLGVYYPGLQYQVRYATNSSVDGSGMLNHASAANLALTTNLYITFPALTAGGTYYWQVRSYDGVGYSSWSAVESFTVYSSTPATAPVPYPSWPVGGATSYINPPTLYWYLGIYATGLYFEVEWSNDGFGIDTHTSGWFASNLYYTISTTLAAGTYTWHVRSKVGVGGTPSAFSTNETFVIPTSTSGSAMVPIPTYPTGGVTVYTLSPTLSWYAYSTSTLEYQINYSPYPDVNGSGVLNHPTVITLPTSITWQSASTRALSGLTAGVTYYWQVRSRVSGTPGTETAWSSVVSFTTAAGASAVVPLVVSPNYGQQVKTSSAVLTWTLPTPTQKFLKYDIEFSRSADMSNSTETTDIGENQYQLTNLQPGTYYWRVVSKTSDGTKSQYSSVGNFNIGGVTAVDEKQEMPNEFSLLQNYPNPFNPSTKITYILPANAYVTLKVYDMLGREVKTLVSQEMTSGRYTIDWNADNNLGVKVSSGMYVYRITAGNFVSTKKMVLIK